MPYKFLTFVAIFFSFGFARTVCLPKLDGSTPYEMRYGEPFENLSDFHRRDTKQIKQAKTKYKNIEII